MRKTPRQAPANACQCTLGSASSEEGLQCSAVHSLGPSPAGSAW